MRSLYLVILLALIPLLSTAQQRAVLFGTVTDTTGMPVDLANVALVDSREGTMTRADGTYELSLPAGREVEIVVSCVGFVSTSRKVTIDAGERLRSNIILYPDVQSLLPAD
jgi:iron complex outermembrane receptor protein